MIICLLDLISGIYLGLSIYRIRKLTKEKGIEINTKIMIVHVLTFILSLLSMFIWVFAIELPDPHAFYYVADIFLYSCACITQMMICFIFWNMDNIKFVPLPAAS
jgi:drug/metabolite transporter (DMT)-like permease